MSAEVLGLRSGGVLPRDFGSVDCYSSSEASSRLAARLEKSEYKRRGKQRLQNHQHGSSRTPRRRARDNGPTRRNGRRKGSNSSAEASQTKESRNYNAKEGVTSIWEVHGQQPKFYSEDSFTETSHYDKLYARDSKSHIIHEVSPDSRTSEGVPHVDKSIGMSGRRNTSRDDTSGYLDQSVRSQTTLASNKSGGQRLRHPEKHRTASRLSRSYSSSFSSQVGSSDEKEDYQGIYSAYDMAGRSPYGSTLNRRYSQSSLSSSSASWHQSSTSFSYNMKELPSLLGDAPPRPRPKSMGFEDQHDNFKITDFNKFRKTPPVVPPKPVKFSSSYTIKLSGGHSPGEYDVLHEQSESSSPKSPHDFNTQKTNTRMVPVLDFNKNSSQLTARAIEGSKTPSNHANHGPKPTVREIVRRFSANVTYISSEYHVRTNSEDDPRRTKTESYPSNDLQNKESSPTRLLQHSEANPYGQVQLRHRGEHKEDLSSHRLSLHELIKLHEEQIAIQSKSAQAAAQVQVFLKRSASDVGRQKPDVPHGSEQQYAKDDTARTPTEGSLVTPMKLSAPDGMNTEPKNVKVEVETEYEVREVMSPVNSPFKVIEITDKTPTSPGGTRERNRRVKRHRTIGIVGYRQQIDRTHDSIKAEPKPKRHTISSVSLEGIDFQPERESTPSRVATEEEMVKPREEEIVKADLVKEETFSGSEIMKDHHHLEIDEGDDDRFVKIIDVDGRPVLPDEIEEENAATGRAEAVKDFEKPVVVVENVDECYSSEPKMEMSEVFGEESTRVQYQPSSSDYLTQHTTVSEYQTAEVPCSVYQEPERVQPAVSSYQSSAAEHSTLTHHPPHTRQAAFTSYHSPITSTLERDSRNTGINTPPSAPSPVVELDTGKNVMTAHYRAAVPSSAPRATISAPHEVKPLKPLITDLHPHPIKAVPIAQVSPVHSQQYYASRTPDNVTKTTPISVTPPEPRSAQEMYKTRLAMWNLIPGWEGASHRREDLHREHGAPQVAPHVEPFLQRGTKAERLDDHALRLRGGENFYPEARRLHPKTEEYYLGIIDRLARENHALRERSEAEKREFKQMYEEQKKVANAYQKLEDRYRRRVHELQDALAGCTCQGTLMMYKRNTKSSNKSDNESERSKALSGKNSLNILDELEEWLSEQSKNTKGTKANNTSRDSLISSSSDLTGTGWDEHYEMMGALDQLDGTHV